MFSHLERFPSPLFSPVSFPLFEKAFSPALPVFVVSENKRQNMYKQNPFFSRLVLSLFRESRFQQFFCRFPSSSSNSKVYLHWGHGSAENGRFAVAFCVERCPWPPNPRSSFQLKKKSWAEAIVNTFGSRSRRREKWNKIAWKRTLTFPHTCHLSFFIFSSKMGKWIQDWNFRIWFQMLK